MTVLNDAAVRISGLVLALAGLLGVIVGLFVGCGSFFAWNGRHDVDVRSFLPGKPVTHVIAPELGRRYTVSVQVVFERAEHISAKMPLVARVVDRRATTLAQTTGWIDPDEAPTVMLGLHPSQRAARETELVAERIIGSFPVTSRDPVDVHVDLGTDRLGAARILEARVVVYDDALPPSIKRAFAAAAAGGVALIGGFGLVLAGTLRRRSRRRQIV